MVGFGLPVPGRVVRPGFIREGPGEAAMVGWRELSVAGVGVWDGEVREMS